jgi:hypothetical protein
VARSRRSRRVGLPLSECTSRVGDARRVTSRAGACKRAAASLRRDVRAVEVA